MKARITCLLAAIGAACALQVHAADESGFDNRLTGDWGGMRSSLAAQGINLSLGYVNEWIQNSSGGERTSSAYADQFALSADVDFNALWGWRGASLHVLVTNRNGPQLDAQAGLGTLLETHEIFGRGHYTRLTRFYLQQELWDNRIVLKAGRSDVDFFPFSCDFINISFCGPLPGYHSNGWYTWPIGQYFANATLRLGQQFEVKVGVLDVSSRNLEGDQGLRLTTPGGGNTGTLSNIEISWLPRFGDGLPGAYRVGYWRNTARFADLLLNQQGQAFPISGGSPFTHDRSTGYYALVQQQLTRDGMRGGLTVFANLSHSDADVNRVDRMLSVGLWYTGMVPSRPDDRLGLAIGQNRVGKTGRRFDRLSNELAGIDRPTIDCENPIELNYTFTGRRGVSITPSLQYVRDPGGRSDASNVWIWGAKLTAEF